MNPIAKVGLMHMLDALVDEPYATVTVDRINERIAVTLRSSTSLHKVTKELTLLSLDETGGYEARAFVEALHELLSKERTRDLRTLDMEIRSARIMYERDALTCMLGFQGEGVAIGFGGYKLNTADGQGADFITRIFKTLDVEDLAKAEGMEVKVFVTDDAGAAMRVLGFRCGDRIMLEQDWRHAWETQER